MLTTEFIMWTGFGVKLWMCSVQDNRHPFNVGVTSATMRIGIEQWAITGLLKGWRNILDPLHLEIMP
jgi:hypothetical protein